MNHVITLFDVLVVGGGFIALALVLELLIKFLDAFNSDI